MTTGSNLKATAAATYNAAADFYDDPANAWDRFGRATVTRLGPRTGARVLDVCCGSGAAAIPAAEMVGPHGFVIGIDLAENLLALARAKARSRGLTNVEFRLGDMLDLQVPEAHFDVVVCVFGIFFAPDMPAAIRGLWRVVRPGGTLALTTWGSNLFEPAATVFWDAVRAVRPDLYKGFNPWDRVSDPSSLRELLSAGGIGQAEVTVEPGRHPLPTADAWWSAVLGSGYRGTVEALDPGDRERVKMASLGFIRQSRVTSVEANVVYGVATKT